ncbi:RNA-directed DNA polymerase, eukaryota, partial [Tanacetum coccineum]
DDASGKQADVNVGLGVTPIATTTPNTGSVSNTVHESPTTVNSTLIQSGPTSYAKLVTREPSRKHVNFRTLIASVGNEADVAIHLESIRATSERFANTAYGFFLRKRVAYPVVANYVRNTWSKYGLVKSMLNSSNGLFFFQFSSEDGLEAMLANGLWFIRNNPFILENEDGLSIIATKLGTPLMLDSYTSGICMQSWGRSSYAGAIIELRADDELKDTIVVAIPNLVGKGFYIPVSNKNGANISGKKKQAEVSTQEVSNSNPFDALNSIKNDDDLGTNVGISSSAGKGVASSGISTSPIAERIDKFERQLIEGKLLLVDDEGKPLPKVDSTVNADSDSEVEEVFDEHTRFMVSICLKRGSDSDYSTNSLLEQWMETKRDDDCDPYDDDMYDSHNMSDNLRVFNVERLVGNLCTLWIGRMHLQANLARFERPSVQSSRVAPPFRSAHAAASFVSAIKGVPLHAWTRNTFIKIGAKWGDVLEMEECRDDSFARKRICIKTKQEDNILEKFKIIVKGKVFVVRAKELFAWSPNFIEMPEMDYYSDVDSVKEVRASQMESCQQENLEEVSDNEAVSDTFFGDNVEKDGFTADSCHPSVGKETSDDPFKIYDLLNRQKNDVEFTGSASSIPFPPGFTPKQAPSVEADQIKQMEHVLSPCKSLGCNSRILENSQKMDDHVYQEPIRNDQNHREGGSILELLEGMLKVGQTMGFSMDGVRNDMEKIIGAQGDQMETKMDSISDMDVKILWGNTNFDFSFSEAVGNSGGILCVWDHNMFRKEHHIISDNFVVLYGTWIPNQMKLMLISVYAPQAGSYKRMLWSYLGSIINRWTGETIVMGDFNEVRRMEERWGSIFNASGARVFNNFISNAGLIDLQLEGFSFTWAHPSASKMSKLDRFLVSDGFISSFPRTSAVCLDRHLSDHRPILLREVFSDFGAIPFRFYHSWFSFQGFDQFVNHTWSSISLSDSNGMIRFKKKLQILKKEIRVFVADQKKKKESRVNDLKDKLSEIDKVLDQGGVSDDILLARTECKNALLKSKAADSRDYLQKAKIQWAVEGDENSKFFHGIVNRKQANLTVKGIMIDGDWVDEPSRVKSEFQNYFADRFQDPGNCNGKINFTFPNRLSLDQVADLENPITRDEIRKAVVGPDFCTPVEWFFDHAAFPIGCNSSFIALIPKSLEPKFVGDFWPISLIGCVYNLSTKILQSRLSLVISDLISDVQTAFLPNRQILDGPFIINELLSRCHHKKQRAMIFKVDFATAYDSIRWDYLEDVLCSFGFGSKWRSWIRGCLTSSMASILVNGSPTSEFQFHRGLKQGDPLAPYLFILVMKSLQLSFSRVIDAGIFTGIRIDPTTLLENVKF